MTPSEFKALFPEFKNQPDAVVQAQLTRADNYISENIWAEWYSEGVGFFVAHQLAISCQRASTKGSDSGDATSKSVGDVSVTKSGEMQKAKMENPFLRTTYGQEYYRLARLVGIGAVAV